MGHGIWSALLNQGCCVAATDLPGERPESKASIVAVKKYSVYT
jgi:hypothetical protein